MPIWNHEIHAFHNVCYAAEGLILIFVPNNPQMRDQRMTAGIKKAWSPEQSRKLCRKLFLPAYALDLDTSNVQMAQ